MQGVISPISVSHRTPVKFRTTNRPALIQLADCASTPRFGADPADGKKLIKLVVGGVVGLLFTIGLIVDDAPRKTIEVKLSDTNGDRKPDRVDIKLSDTNGNWKPEKIEVIPVDTDGDGKPDKLEIKPADTDGDGKADILEAKHIDTNGDGQPDEMDFQITDCDDDGKPEKLEVKLADTNGDGKADILKTELVYSAHPQEPHSINGFYGYEE